MPGLGQGFKGYNRWILLPIITYPSKPLNAEFSFPISTSDFRIPTSDFKIYPSHPLSETDLKPDEDTISLIRSVWVFSTLNVEPGSAELVAG